MKKNNLMDFWSEREPNLIKGFTLTELLLVVGIILIVMSAGAVIYGRFLSSTQVNDYSSILIQTIRSARTRAAAGLNASPHGVYMEINEPGADRVILYQGNNYVSRDASYDWAVELDSGLSLSSTLTGNEVVFAFGTGVPNNTGIITIGHSAGGEKSIIVNSLGMVDGE